jgi:hypothetical protein
MRTRLIDFLCVTCSGRNGAEALQMEGLCGLDVESFKKLIANDELNCPEIGVFDAVRRYKTWNKLK